jgi:hypothetical protein
MRRPTAQTQLEWVDPQTLRWEDLPASVRDRLREHLGALLRQAVHPARAEEGSNEE